jgi:hypothetical protein
MANFKYKLLDVVLSLNQENRDLYYKLQKILKFLGPSTLKRTASA